VCLVGTYVLEELVASIFKVLGGLFCLGDGGCRLFRNVSAVSTLLNVVTTQELFSHLWKNS
jgi:hypothetical protein